MSRQRKGMGTITQLKNGRFMVKVPVGKDARGKTRYVTKKVATKSEAVQVQKRLLSEREQQFLHAGPRTTFRQLAEDILFTPTDKIQVRTQDGYFRTLRKHVFPKIGSKPIVDIRVTDVDRILSEIRKTHAAGTTNNVRVAMSKVFSEAVRQEYRFDNPVAKTRKSKRGLFEKTNVQVPWSEAELQSFVQASAKSTQGGLFLLLAATGLRVGEALGLKWEDLNLDMQAAVIMRSISRVSLIQPDGTSVSSILVKPPKTVGSQRVIRLIPEVVSALRFQEVTQSFQRQEAGEKWVEEGWVFANKIGGSLDYNNVRRTYTKFIESNKLRYIRMHDIRHTFATRLIERDSAALPEVSKALGHSSVAITMNVYASTARISDKAFASMSDILYPSAEPVPEFKTIDNEIVVRGQSAAPWREAAR